MHALILAERFQTHLSDLVKELQAEHGDLIRMHAPGKGNFLIALDPEDVCEVYKNNGKFPFQPGFETIGYYRKQRKDLYTENGNDDISSKK